MKKPAPFKPSPTLAKHIDRAVDRYAQRLVDMAPLFAAPSQDYWPPMEYKVRDLDEQISTFEMFWSGAHYRYDQYRMQLPRKAYDKPPTRTIAVACGVYVWNPVDALKMFDTQQIVSPLDCPLNVDQWRRLVMAGLFKRAANWEWVPAAQRAADDNEDWSEFHVCGWRMTNPNVRMLRDIPETDTIITPQGIFNYREYLTNQPIWKGQSLFADITTSIFRRLNA